MKVKYSFSQEDHEQIKAARKKNRGKQIDRRLEVLKLRCEGMSHTEGIGSSIVLNFIFFLAVPHGMWDLSSLIRDQIHTLCTGSTIS